MQYGLISLSSTFKKDYFFFGCNKNLNFQKKLFSQPWKVKIVKIAATPSTRHSLFLLRLHLCFQVLVSVSFLFPYAAQTFAFQTASGFLVQLCEPQVSFLVNHLPSDSVQSSFHPQALLCTERALGQAVFSALFVEFLQDCSSNHPLKQNFTDNCVFSQIRHLKKNWKHSKVDFFSPDLIEFSARENGSKNKTLFM